MQSDPRPPNWAAVYQAVCKEYSRYGLHDILDLTIPDIVTLIAKFSPSEVEPEWFVTGLRSTQDPKERLRLLSKLVGDK